MSSPRPGMAVWLVVGTLLVSVFVGFGRAITLVSAALEEECEGVHPPLPGGEPLLPPPPPEQQARQAREPRPVVRSDSLPADEMEDQVLQAAPPLGSNVTPDHTTLA